MMIRTELDVEQGVCTLFVRKRTRRTNGQEEEEEEEEEVTFVC